MNYLEADEAIKYEDEKFSECRAVKLFYVIFGRNAWHDTWITRYFDGCMCSSFDEAKLVAEKRRVQGTVFHIREIPALQFVSTKLSVIITEINSEQPLKYQQEWSDDSALTLPNIYSYFTPLNQHSILRLIRLKSQSSNLFEPLLKSNQFKQYKSFSKGKDYRLGWQDVDHVMSSTAVDRLAANLDRVIVSQKRMEFQAICSDLANKFQSLVEELELSVRTANALKNAGIRFVGDLVQYTDVRLKNLIDNDNCIKEIKDVLADINLNLKAAASDIRDKSVDELELSIRTSNALRNAQIFTIGDLTKLSESDLLKKQNTGRKSVNEIKDVLGELGLELVGNV